MEHTAHDNVNVPLEYTKMVEHILEIEEDMDVEPPVYNAATTLVQEYDEEHNKLYEAMEEFADSDFMYIAIDLGPVEVTKILDMSRRALLPANWVHSFDYVERGKKTYLQYALSKESSQVSEVASLLVNFCHATGELPSAINSILRHKNSKNHMRFLTAIYSIVGHDVFVNAMRTTTREEEPIPLKLFICVKQENTMDELSEHFPVNVWRSLITPGPYEKDTVFDLFVGPPANVSRVEHKYPSYRNDYLVTELWVKEHLNFLLHIVKFVGSHPYDVTVNDMFVYRDPRGEVTFYSDILLQIVMGPTRLKNIIVMDLVTTILNECDEQLRDILITGVSNGQKSSYVPLIMEVCGMKDMYDPEQDDACILGRNEFLALLLQFLSNDAKREILTNWDHTLLHMAAGQKMPISMRAIIDEVDEDILYDALDVRYSVYRGTRDYTPFQIALSKRNNCVAEYMIYSEKIPPQRLNPIYTRRLRPDGTQPDLKFLLEHNPEMFTISQDAMNVLNAKIGMGNRRVKSAYG